MSFKASMDLAIDVEINAEIVEVQESFNAKSDILR